MASTILTVVLGLGTFGCTIYLLVLLAKEKGAAHGVLGFFFPPYPYVWGWINGRRLQIVDVMVFWTLISIAALVFPIVMGFRSAASTGLPLASDAVGFESSSTLRGTVQRGVQVGGQIEDLFAEDEWMFEGTAGEQVTIVCAPAAGSDTDPRITVFDPQGREIASDDDGGGDRTARLGGLVLPSSGTYRIVIDVWFSGPYVLTVQ